MKGTSSSEPFWDSKINEFDFLSVAVIHDILRLDISMNNIKIMEITESLHELKHYFFDLSFTAELCFIQGGVINQLHYKPTHSFP